MARTRLTRSERATLTRQDLLEAAEERFVRDGYHATSLEDIADDAGYTKGAVYSAYESKAGLFLALLDVVIDRRLADVRALLNEHQTGPELLAALAAQPAEERDTQFLLLELEFLIHAARQPALLEKFAERYRRLRESFTELAPGSTPLGAKSWTIATLALSNGLALERLIDPDGVPDDLMAAVQYRIVRPDPESADEP
ncbi:MAG: TetR family transcriptional regulator [Actinomycetota bacterium]|nr:TetR family transcriptional regulator [Actinomycetota bacterium]